MNRRTRYRIWAETGAHASAAPARCEHTSVNTFCASSWHLALQGRNDGRRRDMWVVSTGVNGAAWRAMPALSTCNVLCHNELNHPQARFSVMVTTRWRSQALHFPAILRRT